MGFLVFFTAAWPLFQLTMQYHYSAKGSILSSAIAASFGGLILMARKSETNMWTQRLTVLSPFVLTTLVYFIMPHKSALLYGLVLSLGIQLFNQMKFPFSDHTGSRSELLTKLTSLFTARSSVHLQKLFLYWATLSLASTLLHKIWPSQFTVCIPLLAFAVFAGSVQNSLAAEESK